MAAFRGECVSVGLFVCVREFECFYSVCVSVFLCFLFVYVSLSVFVVYLFVDW